MKNGKTWKYWFAICWLFGNGLGNAMAQECTEMWDTYFDTNPAHSKYLLGDTSTGYGVFYFWGASDLAFEIRGEFPKSRFLSFETEKGILAISHDHLFDKDIEPDEGSTNPFREGADMAAPNRSYTVWAMQGEATHSNNTIQLSDGLSAKSIMLRIYSPNEGVSLSRSDLPRIYAIDKMTGAPRLCPKKAHYDPKFHFPEFLAEMYVAAKPFEFKPAGEMKIGGLNKAIGYLYALTALADDEVALIRFRAPTFLNTHAGNAVFHSQTEVRYWSLCTTDFTKNHTYNCLPDYLSQPDEQGIVTVVVSGDGEVQNEAKLRGYSFLPDLRNRSHNAMGFVYRNLLPSFDFKEHEMYQGAYAPISLICSKTDFFDGKCGE